ncbi:hypothetical protein [Protaetiibacter intestinalis]|uniref:Uncharacterized protein n=1 Tax=Protaetiibacter intestinalis TaxID=2419774 RepID=A0A387B929_9MICO|nr:hypothetical protein [Protaetiibacter intestinalis]AYF97685.1 hypothetical protein D7I47_05065 [Protaetiibacter intestinalis]
MTTTPEPTTPAEAEAAAPERRSRAATLSLYLTIGTLLAAALLGGYFIIIGDQANVAGRAWFTLFLVAAFAGAVVLDAYAAHGPNKWYLAASTIVNVVIVAVGLLKIWNGWLQPENTADPGVWIEQTGRLIAVIVLLRVALLVTQLYGLYFVSRAKSKATRYSSMVTILFVWVVALILAIPSAFPAPEWPDWWWRAAGAAALVAVVSLVIPLVVRAFEPKSPAPAVQAPAAGYGAPVQYVQQPVQYQPIPPGYAPVQQAPVAEVPPVPQAPVAEVPPVPQAPAAGEPAGEPGAPVPPQ